MYGIYSYRPFNTIQGFSIKGKFCIPDNRILPLKSETDQPFCNSKIISKLKCPLYRAHLHVHLYIRVSQYIRMLLILECNVLLCNLHVIIL